jgi:O-antigen/teichoic acid export membrane protein
MGAFIPALLMSKQTTIDQAPGEHSLAVSIGKSTIFGVIARCAQVGTRLITVPIVIGHLGIGGYGIWAILMTAAAYMRFGSIGIKSAFQKYVAEATGNGDFETTNRLLSTGTAGMLVLSFVGLIPICVFSRNLAQIAGVPPEMLKASSESISVLALIMLMSNVGAAFEAIVMGGHRIDIARKFTTFFTVAEAVAIVILLHFGFGLFGMACTMGLSEVGFVLCCYVAARKVLPQVHVRWKYVTKTAVPELFRYAGSYQLVNVMEVVFSAIIPLALLRVFGAEAAGVFALAYRLQNSAQMLADAVLLPILSGGAKMYGAGSGREMNLLIAKSFKVTMGLALLPLGFFSVFGTTVVLVWTGQTIPGLGVTLWLVCLAGFFSTFSILGLVLYRVSGHALLDNIRQVLRIVILLSIALFARRLGFYGVLAGLAVTELTGMLFMIYAISRTFEGFQMKVLLPDAVRVALGSIAILAAGALAAHLPFPHLANPRMLATLKLGMISLGCLLAAWPALYLTNAVTTGERRALLGVLLPQRIRTAQVAPINVTE